VESFKKQIENWKNGARVTELAGEFESLASGLAGKPVIDEVVPDFSLFNGRSDILEFYDRYSYYSGKFNLHFLSSIPYILEEECRLGTTLVKYLLTQCSAEGRTASIQTIGNAEGVIARTIADIGNGRIATLTNSPTVFNKQEFFSRHVKNSFFYLGPFFDITKEMLIGCESLKEFSQGFDVVYEDTTFQMYGPDREDQIAFVLQNLREEGIFICLEKCLQTDKNEYSKREDQKNSKFKNNYFSQQQLAEKETILQTMHTGQVMLSTLNSAIKKTLAHTKLVWNSGNFYIIAASDNLDKLDSFVRLLGPACIRPEFSYEKTPSNI
jgi:tRNA (cmo5U34)-methyltransferase